MWGIFLTKILCVASTYHVQRFLHCSLLLFPVLLRRSSASKRPAYPFLKTMCWFWENKTFTFRKTFFTANLDNYSNKIPIDTYFNIKHKFTIMFKFCFLPDRYKWWWEWNGSNAEIDTAIKTTKSMGWTICISDSWTPTGTYFTSTWWSYQDLVLIRSKQY